MRLSLTVARHELVELANELTPARVELSRRPRRVLELGAPVSVELVDGVGLRLRGDARLEWEVAGLVIPATVRAWRILLVPSFAEREGAHLLVFEPVLEELAFRRVPGFFDDRLAAALNELLAAQRRRLAWDLGRRLSVRLHLPSRLAPAGALELNVSAGEARVTSTEVQLSLSLAARVTRRPEERPLAVSAQASR